MVIPFAETAEGIFIWEAEGIFIWDGEGGVGGHKPAPKAPTGRGLRGNPPPEKF